MRVFVCRYGWMPGEHFLPDWVAPEAKDDNKVKCAPGARVVGIGHYVLTTCPVGNGLDHIGDKADSDALRAFYNAYCGPCPEE